MKKQPRPRSSRRRLLGVLLVLLTSIEVTGCGHLYESRSGKTRPHPVLDLTRVERRDEILLVLVDGERRQGVVQDRSAYGIQINDYWYGAEVIADAVVLGEREDAAGSLLAGGLALTIAAALLGMIVVGGATSGIGGIGR